MSDDASTIPDDEVRQCIKERKCTLCWFELKEGGLVMGTSSHCDIAYTHANSIDLVVEWGGSRLEFKFKGSFVSNHFYIGHTHIEINDCPGSRCEFNDGAIPCLHRACRRAFTSQLSEDLVAATAFSFSPDDSEVERRKDFLRTEFAVCST